MKSDTIDIEMEVRRNGSEYKRKSKKYSNRYVR